MDLSAENEKWREAVTALRRIIRAVDLHSRSLVQRCGLTGPQLLMLHRLASAGEISIGELAVAVSLSQPTVTGILDRLERRGLVRRRRSPDDKRRVLVRTTPACKRLLASAPPLLQESFVRQFTGMGDWEQNLILSSLQRVVAMMEAAEMDAAPILTTGPIHPAGGTSGKDGGHVRHLR